MVPKISPHFFYATRFQCRCMVQPPQKMIRYPLPKCAMLHATHPTNGIGSRVCQVRCKEVMDQITQAKYDDQPEYPAYDPFGSPELPFGGYEDPNHGPPMNARVWPVLHWFTR